MNPLRAHLNTLSIDERGPRLRALIAEALAFLDGPAPDGAAPLAANVERILVGQATKADTTGRRERAEAYASIRDSGRELLPEVEREEIESIRSKLQATADKLHAVAIARRSKIIRNYWTKRRPDASDDGVRSAIRVIFAATDFPSPEYEAWEAGKALLVETHGQAIVDAAGVTYSDPDIREQVARECLEVA